MENLGHDVVSDGEHCNGHVSSHPMQGNRGLTGADHANIVDDYPHITGSSRAAQAAHPDASGMLDQAARQADSSALQQACFSEELVGIRVCFQLVDLGRQLYVWAGLESGALGCMCLASPPAGDYSLASVRLLTVT